MVLLAYGSEKSMVDVRDLSADPRGKTNGEGSVTKSFASSVTEENASSSLHSWVERPFFIMDWLEDVNQEDLELARRMLQTPQKKPFAPDLTDVDLQECRQNIFHRSSPQKQFSTFAPISPFHKRSIDMGSGWNAKGLQKAKNGAWEDALACWDNALEIRRQVLGEDHIDVANTLNNMGIAQGKLNRCDEALKNLRRALYIRRKHYGDDHTEIAATLHNIGNVLHQTGDLPAAVDAFLDSKVMLERLLGSHDVQVARTCIAIGHVYHQASEYEDAREAYVDALAIFQQAGLPKNHLEVQATISTVKELDSLLREF